MKVDAAPAQFSKISRNHAEFGIEFHSHWHHPIAIDQAGVPDLPAAVGVLVFAPVGDDLFADDLAQLRRAGEVLIAVGGQGFPLTICKAKIVEPAAILHRNNDITIFVLGEVALQQKERRQLVDGAPYLLGRNENRLIGKRAASISLPRCRRHGNRGRSGDPHRFGACRPDMRLEAAHLWRAYHEPPNGSKDRQTRSPSRGC